MSRQKAQDNRQKMQMLRPPARSRGFTLIELVVVTAIIVLISAVVLANQNKFGGQVLLQNFAYDLALSIRQAQVYGIAVARTAGNNPKFNSFGIHFDISQPTSYDIFSDTNQNGVEDNTGACDGTGECVQRMNITRGYSISGIYVTTSGQGETPGNKKLDVLFQRPEPDALISWTDGSSGTHNCITASNCALIARIQLQSPRNDIMSVTVNANGQIAVVNQ